MFIYGNKNRDICIDIQDPRPVGSPDYILSIDSAEGLLVNGLPVKPLTSTVLDEDQVFTTAQEIKEPVFLNLNNKSITAPEDTAGDGIFHVVAGGSLIIDGEGTINGVGANDYNMAIWADGGNVTINGGTITNVGATAKVDPAHFDLIYAKNGSTVIINGGYFECETPKWTLNLNDSNPGKIIVRGGTFYNFDPSRAETEPGGLYNFVDDGYKVTKDGDYYIVSK